MIQWLITLNLIFIIKLHVGMRIKSKMTSPVAGNKWQNAYRRLFLILPENHPDATPVRIDAQSNYLHGRHLHVPLAWEYK